MIDEYVVFLCGKKNLEQWGSNLNMRKSIQETCMETVQTVYRMITTDTSHYRVRLKTQNKKETEIMYLEEK